MVQVFFAHGELAVFFCNLLILAGAAGLGSFFGARRPKDQEEASNLIQSAMLTLLSLLMAFGVSMAELRYEARKQIEIEESNAIGTSYLRTDLLPAGSAGPAKRLLKSYLDHRINFYLFFPTETRFSDSESDIARIQGDLWAIASREMLRKPTVGLGLVLSSLNQMFDLREKQFFSFANRVPGSIIGLLYLMTTLVMCLVGYLNAKKSAHHVVATMSLVLVFTMTLFVILDLDRPRKGLIHVAPEDLIRIRQSLSNTSK